MPLQPCINVCAPHYYNKGEKLVTKFIVWVFRSHYLPFQASFLFLSLNRYFFSSISRNLFCVEKQHGRKGLLVNIKVKGWGPKGRLKAGEPKVPFTWELLSFYTNWNLTYFNMPMFLSHIAKPIFSTPPNLSIFLGLRSLWFVQVVQAHLFPVPWMDVPF